MLRSRSEVTYLSFGYHGDRSSGVIPEPSRQELIVVGTRILTAWYATSVLAGTNVDSSGGLEVEARIAATLREGLAKHGAHTAVECAGIALTLHSPSGWECGLVGNHAILRTAIIAAAPIGSVTWLSPFVEVVVEWGNLSIETNIQHPKSELGRHAMRAWRAERERLASA